MGSSSVHFASPSLQLSTTSVASRNPWAQPPVANTRPFKTAAARPLRWCFMLGTTLSHTDLTGSNVSAVANGPAASGMGGTGGMSQSTREAVDPEVDTH